MQQGAARRQGVGRGAGGCGDDQAVCALVRHEMAVHLDPQFHHARGASAIDDYVVHGKGIEDAAPVPHDPGMYQAAVVFLVLAAQHGGEHLDLHPGAEIARHPLAASDVRLGFCNEIYGKKIVQRAEFS